MTQSKNQDQLTIEFEKKEKRRKQLREAQKEHNLLHNRGKKKIQFHAEKDLADFLQLVKERENVSKIGDAIHIMAEQYRLKHEIEFEKLDRFVFRKDRD